MKAIVSALTLLTDVCLPHDQQLTITRLKKLKNNIKIHIFINLCQIAHVVIVLHTSLQKKKNFIEFYLHNIFKSNVNFIACSQTFHIISKRKNFILLFDTISYNILEFKIIFIIRYYFHRISNSISKLGTRLAHKLVIWNSCNHADRSCHQNQPTRAGSSRPLSVGILIRLLICC